MISVTPFPSLGSITKQAVNASVIHGEIMIRRRVISQMITFLISSESDYDLNLCYDDESEI